MQKGKKRVALAIIILIPSVGTSQLFRIGKYWKYYRQAIIVGAGATNFLGELGGRDAIGSPFIYDLEIVATRPGIHIGYRYNLTREISLLLFGFWGRVTGADSLTKEMFRHNRNIHFRSDIWEITLNLRYQLLEESPGHRYKLRKVRGRKAFVLGLYLQAGLGIFFFEPKAQYKGTWYKLRLLSTEGQGIKKGTKPYKPYSVAIPLVVGFTYAFDLRNRFELEVGWRKTFTDYIDDTSTEYYDPDEIRKAKGPVAAYFSNPCICTEEWQKWSTMPGQQRGDPKDKDAYVTLMINYVHLLKTTRRGAPRWFYRRKARPSF